MLRNAAVALGNSGQREAAVPVLAKVLREEEEPLVRAHVAWALGELGGQEAKQALETASEIETDGEVRLEIDDALKTCATAGSAAS
jgi:epoxyqueuosine reductase